MICAKNVLRPVEATDIGTQAPPILLSATKQRSITADVVLTRDSLEGLMKYLTPYLVPCLPFPEGESLDRMVPAAARNQFALCDDAGELGGETHETFTAPTASSDREDGWETYVDKQQSRRNYELLPRNHREIQPRADVSWERRQDGDQNADKRNISSRSTLSLIANRKISSNNSRVVADSLVNAHPTPGRKHLTRAVAGAARPEQPPTTSGKQAWELSNRHPLDTLRRERGFESASAGAISGSGASTVDYAVVITKLKTSLRRAQEENARERERRQECEDQARMAHVSLEAESKR